MSFSVEDSKKASKKPALVSWLEKTSQVQLGKASSGELKVKDALLRLVHVLFATCLLQIAAFRLLCR